MMGDTSANPARINHSPTLFPIYYSNFLYFLLSNLAFFKQSLMA